MGRRRVRISIDVLAAVMSGRTFLIGKTNMPADLRILSIYWACEQQSVLELLASSAQWREVPAGQEVPLLQAIYYPDPRAPLPAPEYAPWIGAEGNPPRDLFAGKTAGGGGG